MGKKNAMMNDNTCAPVLPILHFTDKNNATIHSTNGNNMNTAIKTKITNAPATPDWACRNTDAR